MRPRALAVLTSASSTARRLCSGGASADTSRILSSKTHFEVLSLPEEVNPESRVKRSFLELAQRVHPDKCHCPEAGKAFNRLKDAFAAIESQELQELQLANLQRERGRGGTASKINDTLEDFSQTRMIAMGVALLIAAELAWLAFKAAFPVPPEVLAAIALEKRRLASLPEPRGTTTPLAPWGATNAGEPLIGFSSANIFAQLQSRRDERQQQATGAPKIDKPESPR